MPLSLTINGQPREFETLQAGATVAELVAAMELKGDRVAVELNHEIAQRANWDRLELQAGDRLEIVHFVGGGCDTERAEVARASVPGFRVATSDNRYYV